MKNDNLIKIIVILLFISFIYIFISGQAGFYEYSNYKKTIFTEDKIKEFEKDVSEGKNVNIKDYVTSEEKDYSNKITIIGEKVSTFIFNIVNNFLKESFKVLEKFIN